MRKFVYGAATLVTAAAMFLPAVSQAKTLPRFSNPLAIDGKGDANAIGKFNKNNANAKLFHMSGKVTAVSATSITVVNGSSPASHTFTVNSSTTVIRKFKGTASITEVMVNDQVSLWATKDNGNALLVWDKSIWWAESRGVISNLNTTTGAFTLTITLKGVQYSTTVNTNSQTTYRMGGVAKSLTNLANGDTVTVRGTWNSTLKVFLARKITINKAV